MPSLFELFGNTGAVLGNPTLRPENALATDFGVSWSPEPFGTEERPIRIAAELFGFVTFADDLIVLVQNGQAVAHAENVSSSRTAGVELGVSLDSPWVGGRLSGTFLDAINTSEIAAERGKTLPNRPRWKGFFRVEGRSSLGSSWGAFRLSTELEAMDGNFVDAANRTLLEPRLWLGVGVGATLWEELDVSVDFKNVLGTTSQDVIGYPLPGFQAMASVRWQAFGSSTRTPSRGATPEGARGAVPP
jgi:iron complex outermembrane receptor protein